MKRMKTFFRNRDGRNRVPLVIEPYGIQVNLLPRGIYWLISEVEDGQPYVPPTVEVAHLGVTLVVYPSGYTSRLYRETSGYKTIVWDNEEPSDVPYEKLPEYASLPVPTGYAAHRS